MPSVWGKLSQHHKSRQYGQQRRQQEFADDRRIRNAHFKKQRIQNGIKTRIPEFRDIPTGGEKGQTPQKQQDNTAYENGNIPFVFIRPYLSS